jgi:hypothetical protein
VKHLQLGNAIVSAAEPPAKLAADILDEGCRAADRDQPDDCAGL